MTSEYLLFDLFILISSTLGYLFYPHGARIHFPSAVKAIVLMAVPFLLMDELVTNWFWHFSPHYTLGDLIGSLPIEEGLFFFCVPWACLILWRNLPQWKRLVDGTLFSWLLFVFLGVFGIWGILTHRWYSATVAVVSFTAMFWIDWRHIHIRSLLFAGITIALTFVFNMYLTARPIVIYNPIILSGFSIGTIPIEDFIYGLILNLGVVALYEYFSSQKTHLHSQ